MGHLWAILSGELDIFSDVEFVGLSGEEFRVACKFWRERDL